MVLQVIINVNHPKYSHFKCDQRKVKKNLQSFVLIKVHLSLMNWHFVFTQNLIFLVLNISINYRGEQLQLMNR